MRIRAHTLNWFKRLMYRLSFHTDVNRALKRRLEDGIRIGRSQAGCPNHGEENVPLQETHRGTFECPLCKPLSAWSPHSGGVYLEHWPGRGPHGDPDVTMPLPFVPPSEMEWLQAQAKEREEPKP